MCQSPNNCCVVLLKLLREVYQIYHRFAVCTDPTNSLKFPCYEEVLKPVKACILDLLHCGEIFCCEGVAESIKSAITIFLTSEDYQLDLYQLIIFNICQTAKSSTKFNHNRRTSHSCSSHSSKKDSSKEDSSKSHHNIHQKTTRRK